MDETQAIDFADYPVEDDVGPSEVGVDQVVGELKAVSEPAETYSLRLGVNIVGRGGSEADSSGVLDAWKAEYTGMPVHGIFIQNSSISSKHAAIFLESAGAVCWMKDLGSRNKTMLGRAGGLTVLQAKGDRYSILPGDKLRFGTVNTVIMFGVVSNSAPAQADKGLHAEARAGHSRHQEISQPQTVINRSPTPDLTSAAAHQIPHVAFPAADNDITLPWDDTSAPQDQPSRDNSNSKTAAGNDSIPPFEPDLANAQAEPPPACLLPETQVNEPVMEPAFPLAEPTQIVSEPTQLALPQSLLPMPKGTPPGPQSGTALATAAAEAMTGAKPTQASVLPSSAPCPAAMPSLAPANNAGQLAAVGVSAPNTDAGAAQPAVAAGERSDSLPVSRPEADAVLHLPSQPSGSMHAAHPHGPPRPIHDPPGISPKGQHPSSAVSVSQHGKPVQAHDSVATAVEASDSQQHSQHQAGTSTKGKEAKGTADESGQSALLESVLGHDDDDSIWMPPASLPDSQGPSQGAKAEADPGPALPAEGGQSLPLDSAGGVQQALPPAGYVSDSDQTQDSQSDTPQKAGETDVNQQPPAPAGQASSPAKRRVGQGRRGLALSPAPAQEGMYTGAFAFPESSSLDVPQAAEAEQPSARSKQAANVKPTGASAPAKAPASTPAAASSAHAAATAVSAAAAPAAKHSKGTESTGRPSLAAAQQPAVRKSSAGPSSAVTRAGGRALPAAWKAKKAHPDADQPPEAPKDVRGDDAAKVAPEEVKPTEKPAKQPTKPSVADKVSPWRTKGTLMGALPGPTQPPDSEDINAAMAAAGDLAALFPSTQAQSEPNSQQPIAAANPSGKSQAQAHSEPKSDHPNDAHAADKADAKSDGMSDPKSSPSLAHEPASRQHAAAAAAADMANGKDSLQSKSESHQPVSDETHGSKPPSQSVTAAAVPLAGNEPTAVAGASVAARPTAQPKGGQKGKPGPASRSAAAAQASVDDQADEEGEKAAAAVKQQDNEAPGPGEPGRGTERGRGRGRTRGRGRGRSAASTKAADNEKAGEEQQQEQQKDSAVNGAEKVGRGKTSQRGRGRSKRSGAGKAAADAGVADQQGDEPEAALDEGKRPRSPSRDPDPPQPTRVSKRQRARQEAAAAAEQEAAAADEQPEDEQQEPFGGSATQAAAGALEELRRSATPEEDNTVAQPDQEDAGPLLQPARKGKHSKSTNAAAASEAAVAAAEALTEGPVSQKSKRQSAGKKAAAKGRGSLKTKGRAAAEDSSGQGQSTGAVGEGNSQQGQPDGAIAETTAGSSQQASHSSVKSTAQQSLRSQQSNASDQADAAQQKQTALGKRSRAKSRLSKASLPEDSAAPDSMAADEQPPAKRKSVGARARGAAAAPSDTVAEPEALPSTSTKAAVTPARQAAKQAATVPDSQPDEATAAAVQSVDAGQHKTAAQATAAQGNRAKRKSALPPAAAATDEAAVGAAAADTGKQKSRRSSQTAFHRLKSGNADQVFGSDAKKSPARRASAPASRTTRPRSRQVKTAASDKVLKQPAEEEEQKPADEEGDQDQAGPSSTAQDKDPAAARAVGASHRGNGPGSSTGKRSRQQMAEGGDDDDDDAAAMEAAGPATHVKAARKATESKQVRVLYSTNIDKSRRAKLSKIIKKLGGAVEEGEGPDFTHFITLQPTSAGQTDRGFKKSINALIALAAGRPIVSDSWVEACGRSHSFVDPVDHLLEDTAAHKKFGFDMRTSYQRAQHQLLLTGLRVFFTPGMLAAETDKGSNIKALVKHAGGTVATKPPNKVSGAVPVQWLFIADEKNINKEKSWAAGKFGTGLSFHSRTMLVDSITRQSLDRKHGVLFQT